YGTHINALYLRDIGRHITYNIKKCEEDRELDQKLCASSRRTGTVLIIYGLNLLILLHHGSLVLLITILFLNLCDLRLHDLIDLHELLLFDRQRKHEQPHKHGKYNDT